MSKKACKSGFIWGNTKLEMTIRHPSGNVSIIFYMIWIEVERRGLGWRWRWGLLLPIACESRPDSLRWAVRAFPIQPQPAFLVASPATALLGSLPSCCLLISLCCRPCRSLCLERPTMSSALVSTLLLLQGSAHMSPLPEALPPRALHKEESTLPCASAQTSASHIGPQLRWIRMRSGTSLGPADTLIRSSFPENIEGMGGDAES